MISSKQVLVTGGQFIQQHYHGPVSVGNQAPIDILAEAVAANALHNSGTSFDKPKCHPRTRVKIREIIMRWISGEDKNSRAGKQFMWLSGAAGCGKSAIAQSTVESCIERGMPLASFFFNRSDSTRNHAGSLVATLTYQLYCAFRGTDVQKDILSAIQDDPLIFKKTIQHQFTSLIIRPLMNHFSKDQSTQLHQAPFLIVTDGLDECIDRNAQKAILTGLAESVCNSNIRIPIFIASRPEHEIKFSFGSTYLKDMHTNLSLDLEDEDDADSDIKLYLFDRFAVIKDDFDNRTTGRKLSQDWPGDWVINELVSKSSRQFIYAATIVRYVESTRHRPDHRLDVVLNLRPDNGDHPFTELDALYSMILESASDIERILHVLSLLLIGVPRICCLAIEKLLSHDEGEVERLFSDLNALVQVHKDGDQLYLRVFHASFREYLVDAARSKQFYIDTDYEIIRHVTNVLRYLATWCCSSSFDPRLFSIAATAMHILRDILYWMNLRIKQITISIELQQAVLFFPLAEFLEPHTSTHTYPQLLEHFVDVYLELLETIVLTDPTLSYVKDHQLEIFRSILVQQIKKYFNDDRLAAAILVLLYHQGSHPFISILHSSSPNHSHSSHSHPLYMAPNFNDVLSLSRICAGYDHGTIEDPSGFLFGNIHHRIVRQLLHGSDRISEYDRGPSTHEGAPWACFKELEDVRTIPLLLSPFENIVFDTVDPMTTILPNPSPVIDIDDVQLLLLGYVILLLPLCGRSDALITACEEYGTRIECVSDRFPIRRRLLHKEIDQYLARVSPTR
ncbi:hypothetical protein D9613_006413 [Agrocybe pediades]|uniref:Nephrocystin 3-like N-terminal domain-containing protein n=1 Tax=Agrocybe pediades TaxID=84607 RepID=A0A8H4QUS3_9AGAR|nr:hypothetical protein D9613_006413 [Agrocybe pediades]